MIVMFRDELRSLVLSVLSNYVFREFVDVAGLKKGATQ